MKFLDRVQTVSILDSRIILSCGLRMIADSGSQKQRGVGVRLRQIV